MIAKHVVTVHGRQFEVTVYQKSKTVWEAVVDYGPVLAVPGGETRSIRVKGRTQSDALRQWVRAAEYWGN